MKSIYSLIHANLKKALVLSLGTTAIILVIYSYFSFRSAKDRAAVFVIDHAAKLAEARINAQDISDIDSEVSRFVEAWKETQDLDLIIDLYLDGQPIAHAGQLQPFERFSSTIEKRFPLPSGKTLRAHVQIDWRQFFILVLAQLLVFELFVVLVFYTLMRMMRKAIREITGPLEARVKWLTEIASALPDSAKLVPALTTSNEIQEIDQLTASIALLLNQISNLEEDIDRITFDRVRIKLAEQVAHNIKGAIARLELRIDNTRELSDRARRELADCIDGIRAVSLNLLKAKKLDDLSRKAHVREEVSAIHLVPTIVSAFELKQLQCKSSGIVLDCSAAQSLYGVFVKAGAAELQAVLSNILDNAIDANASRIDLKSTHTNQRVELRLEDNGRGVPCEILPRLMIEGFSYGKPNGNGIGLSHAKEKIESWGGTIHIESAEGKGTAVIISLPVQAAPSSFVNQIEVGQDSDVLIIDDDPLVHNVWETRIAATGLDASKVRHFYSAQEFEKWIASNSQYPFDTRHYFFDYDLKDKNSNGLDLIERHGLGLESLLVTGLANDELIIKRAERMGVSCLMKDHLGVIPIVVRKNEEKVLAALSVAIK